jgi:2-dehydro-3-deoxyphosphooctonate aldolase (KDO 8-P synthase)
MMWLEWKLFYKKGRIEVFRSKVKKIKVDDVVFGGRELVFIAGPCVIESVDGVMTLAAKLVKLACGMGVPLIFKASFDKANRSSVDSYRGPGLREGLAVLREVRNRFNVPVLTDIHETWQAEPVAEVVDVLQIPAFLCRQTDLILAAAQTGKVVNVKKGQFLAPEDMINVVDKIRGCGNERIILTERGTSFGYHNLVADMRSLLIMRDLGYPVVFDATHSVQRPGGIGKESGGDGQWAPALARAAVATGVDGIFMETHLNPSEALSDKANAIDFKDVKKLWRSLRQINEL